MTKSISSNAALQRELKKATRDRKALIDEELWLSCLELSPRLVNPFDKIAPPAATALNELVKPWRQLTKHLAQHCTAKQPLSVLALHSTAQALISLDSSKTRNRTKDELLIARARKTHVAKLILSGQSYHDSYWRFLNVSEEVTVRGCVHTFREVLLGRLARLEADVPTLRLQIMGEVQWLWMFAFVQSLGYLNRIRNWLGKKKFVESGGDATQYDIGNRHFALIIVQANLDLEDCQVAESAWPELDKEYTKGTKLVVGPHMRSTLQTPKTAVSIPDAEAELFASDSPAVSPPTSRNVSATHSRTSVATSWHSSSKTLVGSDKSSVTLVDSFSSSTTLVGSEDFTATPPTPIGQDNPGYVPSKGRSAPTAATVIEGCNCLNPGVNYQLFDMTRVSFRPTSWMWADEADDPSRQCVKADEQWRREYSDERFLEDLLTGDLRILLQ